MTDKSNELFLSPDSLKKVIQELIDDVPDLDGGDFYTNRTTGRKYGSWRTKVDPKTESYLTGFKEGLEAIHKVIGGQGGSTIWGLMHLGCPYKVIDYAQQMKESGSYSFGGTHCKCDKCLADIKRVDDANPNPECDCDSEYTCYNHEESVE